MNVHINHPAPTTARGPNRDARRRAVRRTTRRGVALGVLAAATLAACGGSSASPGPAAASTTSAAPTTSSPPGHHDGATMSVADRARAQRATAAYQDVAVAEAAGYASSLTTLGCFQDPDRGGMGVHYIDQSLLDGVVDIAHPEALVYELDATGRVAGLVAHEYIVPVEAWTAAEPPSLFGESFHRHPTLPLWVLHTWLWKDNATGVFEDWNPAVRLCPAGVPVFGVDLPAPAAAPTMTTTG